MEKFLIGLWVGVLVACLFVALFPGKNYEDMKAAIKECEQTLPRDVNCVVRAEPMLEQKK